MGSTKSQQAQRKNITFGSKLIENTCWFSGTLRTRTSATFFMSSPSSMSFVRNTDMEAPSLQRQHWDMHETNYTWDYKCWYKSLQLVCLTQLAASNSTNFDSQSVNMSVCLSVSMSLSCFSSQMICRGATFSAFFQWSESTVITHNPFFFQNLSRGNWDENVKKENSHHLAKFNLSI